MTDRVREEVCNDPTGVTGRARLQKRGGNNKEIKTVYVL